MPDVASLQVVVSADTTAAESSLNSFGSKVGSVGSAITGALGGAAVAAVAGLGAAFVGSVKSAADFEKQMSAISAVSGATATEMQALNATALQLGKDTSFSATEAAQGMEELVKAGVSVADVMGGGARAALDLAAAGAVSVADAAEIASNAMNVFNIAGSDMGHVADVIAGAANASAISVTDYKFSLSAAGAVAATVGIGFEDLSQAIAVMGQAGIKGSDAGTSLKTMMLNLVPTSKSAIAAFRELGILTEDGGNKFFDAAGKAKPLAQIAEVLKTAFGEFGATEKDTITLLERMFGSDAIRAGAVLTKEGAAGFEAMAAAMGKVSAQAVAEERLNNLWGSVEKLTGSLETAAIMFGGLITPTLKTWADAATSAVNEAIVALEQIPDIIETIKQVMAGDWSPAENIQPVTLAVGELAVAFRDTLWPAIQAVVGFMTGTVVPAFQAVGGFLAAHPGLVAALAAAWGTFVVLQTVAGWVMGLVAAFGAASTAITAAGGVIGAIVALLGGPLTVAILAVSAAVALLVVAWTENWGGIQEKTAAAWVVIEPIFTQLVDWLGVKIKAALDWLTTTGWPALVAAGETVGTFITGTLIPALTDLMEWLGPKIVAVCTWISETGWPALVTAGETVWAVVQEIIRFFQELYVELDKRGVFEQLGAIWNTLVEIGGRVWDIIQKIAAALAPLFEWVVKLVGETVVPMLVSLFGSLAEKAGAAVSPVDLVAGAISAFFSIIQTQLSWLNKLIEGVQKLGSLSLPSWMGGSGGGGSSDPQAYLKQAALARGIDPEQVAKVMMSEGPGGWDAVGSFDTGTSYGPLQLHYAGGSNPQAGMGDAFTKATGIDLRVDRSLKAQQAAIDYALDQLAATGNYSEWYGADKALGSRFTPVNRVQPQSQRGAPQVSQFAMGLSPDEALAACGPAALNWFMNIAGRTPTGAEARDLADAAGWDATRGMYGPQAFSSALTMAGISNAPDYTPTAAEVEALAGAGMPFALSTGGTATGPGHYYQVAGGSLGALNVGASGTAAGGSAVMSLDQIIALSGAMNGIITLAPQMGAALASSSAVGGAALDGLLVSTTTMADGSTIAVTQMGEQITATITDASGQVTAQYGAMATGVTTATTTMATTALTSVTDLGGAIMTTTTDMAGSTVTTIADMSGQVTSQYATLANGVSLTMGDMSTGVLTSTTDLGTGVMTTVQDMSGNYITTITDLSGNVTSQYVSLGAAVTAETATMAADVTAETATMGEAVLTSVTDMGDGLITITTDAAGNMTATITDMAGNITSTYSSMSNDVVGTAEEMAQTVVETMEDAGGDIQGAVEEWGSSIGDELGSIADDAADQAQEIGQGITDGIASGIEDGSGDVMDAVQQVVEDAIDEAKDAAESDSPSKLFARELGLPIAQGVAVGIEKGSGLVADATRGLVGVPEYAAPLPRGYGGGGGSMDTIVVQIDLGGSVAEELYITGRELAVKRGRA